jgi:hypothetical protein
MWRNFDMLSSLKFSFSGPLSKHHKTVFSITSTQLRQRHLFHSTMNKSPSKSPSERSLVIDARKHLDDLTKANEMLKKARDDHESAYDVEVKNLQEKEMDLLARYNKIEEEKGKVASINGHEDVTDDDLIEVNAGGKIIAARRGTLTQWTGTRLEALFSGRWDKRLLRDSSGRIFLDVNGACFLAIVIYLNELASSTEDSPPEPPSVYEELEPMLAHQLELLEVFVPPHPQMPDSNIIEQSRDASILHNWLKEDGSDGEWDLIYRSSRDGFSNEAFHNNCDGDDKGRTLVVIKTTEGDIVGGYTNTPWQSEGGYRAANKAFLFALNGFGITSPLKMKLKNASENAIEHNARYGPIFGQSGGDDLFVSGSTLNLNIGNAYEAGPGQLTGRHSYSIKEMEVYKVSDCDSWLRLQYPRKSKKHFSNVATKLPAVKRFTEEVNEAINEKYESLRALEEEVVFLEERFKYEERFIASFASGDTKDVIALNVSGTIMATKRATLMVAEESMLAQQFDDTKWTEQGSGPRVKEWAHDEVAKWVKSIKDIPNEVSQLFSENEISGSELLAMNEFGLEKIGVKRAGTICLLLKEIKQLEQASRDVVTFIEHSPYCFGKILDYLRLKQLHSVNLAEAPALPTARTSQKKLFHKVVNYYFPGDSSKFILG